MKKIVILTGAFFLALTLVASAEPSVADQKWLGAVKTMVTEGKTKVSTPSEERSKLLKEWAEKNGYSVAVTKMENSFSIELSRKNQVASNR